MQLKTLLLIALSGTALAQTPPSPQDTTPQDASSSPPETPQQDDKPLEKNLTPRQLSMVLPAIADVTSDSAEFAMGLANGSSLVGPERLGVEMHKMNRAASLAAGALPDGAFEDVQGQHDKICNGVKTLYDATSYLAAQLDTLSSSPAFKDSKKPVSLEIARAEDVLPSLLDKSMAAVDGCPDLGADVSDVKGVLEKVAPRYQS